MLFHAGARLYLPSVLVNVRDNYECEPESCLAGYDGLHPNAIGEYQIAQAFSKALVDGFGIGKTPLIIPGHIADKAPSVPTGLKIETPAYGLRVSCNKVFGAVGYEFRSRLAGADWPTDIVTWPTWQVTNSWVLDGQRVSVHFSLLKNVSKYPDSRVISVGVSGPVLFWNQSQIRLV